jgi:hypothetical protein
MGGVLKVGKMSLFTRGDKVRPTVPINVTQSHVFYSRHFGALPDCNQFPPVGIFSPESDSQVMRIFVYRYDIHRSVPVDVAHHQPIATPDGYAAI